MTSPPSPISSHRGDSTSGCLIANAIRRGGKMKKPKFRNVTFCYALPRVNATNELPKCINARLELARQIATVVRHRTCCMYHRLRVGVLQQQ
ncbi:hypothetical protein V6N11_070925 [Hibiscus sabdariffa]|uniref:Uncharacterized protein n=2 Tax=Hibiscus sabdariffa TaxID=183260 RepID=A0ABR1ZWN2_9ROSI